MVVTEGQKDWWAKRAHSLGVAGIANGYFNSVRFLTTAIVSEMGYSSGLHRQVLFTIGLVLFVFIMIINVVLNKILKKGADDNE